MGLLAEHLMAPRRDAHRDSDLEARLETMRMARSALPLAMLVALMIDPVTSGGAVIVSCCDGLGALLYIVMVVLRIPVRKIIMIENDDFTVDQRRMLTAPLVAHIKAAGGVVEELWDVTDVDLARDVGELLGEDAVTLFSCASCCGDDATNKPGKAGVKKGPGLLAGKSSEATFWATWRLYEELNNRPEQQRTPIPYIKEYPANVNKATTHIIDSVVGGTRQSLSAADFHAMVKMQHFWTNFESITVDHGQITPPDESGPNFGVGGKHFEGKIGRHNRGAWQGRRPQNARANGRSKQGQPLPIAPIYTDPKVGRGHTPIEDACRSGYALTWAHSLESSNGSKTNKAIANLWPVGPVAHALSALALAWDLACDYCRQEGRSDMTPRIDVDVADGFYRPTDDFLRQLK